MAPPSILDLADEYEKNHPLILAVGSKVERLDNYRRDGVVVGYNPDTHPVRPWLVKWAPRRLEADTQWCEARMLTVTADPPPVHEATLTARFYPDTHPDIVLVCSCGETIVLGENITPTHAVESLAAHISAATP